MLNQIAPADLRALKVFKVVAECGGYEAAQDILDLNMSTISTQISGFEKRIGFRLCMRGRKGFQLTERGAVVLEEYQRLQSAMDNFRQVVNGLYDEAVGSLRLGVLDNMISETRFSIVDVLRRYTKIAPKVQIELVQDIQTRLLHYLIEDRLDVVIGTFDERTHSIKARRLYSERQKLYCGQGHEFFDAANDVSNEQIEAANWVDRGYVMQGQYAHSILPNNTNATAANLESVLMLILTGRYIGYLPVHYAYDYVEAGRLKPIQGKKYQCDVDFQIISRAGRHDTMAMYKFRNLCLAQAKNIPSVE